MLQDAGGDVVALCDMNGPSQKARVVGQWRYDAYGAATASEHLAWFPQIHCGHKALFFDRLDVGVADSQGNEPPRLIPYAHLIVQMRNRAYNPSTGRFNQADPNETAAVLLADAAYHGAEIGAALSGFDMQAMYGDGLNLYQYLGSNPWTRSDPLGLEWDPFDMVDEYIAEDMGSKRAFLERIAGSAHVAAYVGAQIASSIPHPLTMALGMLALQFIDEPESLGTSEAWQMAKATRDSIYKVLLIKFLGQSSIAYATTSHAMYMQHGFRGVAGSSFRAGQQAIGRYAKDQLAMQVANWLAGGGGGYSVYQGIKDGKTYIGISMDLERREKEHGFKIEAVKGLTNLTMNQARAYETYLMTSDPNLRPLPNHVVNPRYANEKRSVGPHRSIFPGVMAWAARQIKAKGITLGR